MRLVSPHSQGACFDYNRLFLTPLCDRSIAEYDFVFLGGGVVIGLSKVLETFSPTNVRM
ncbi:hypothetical protein MTTB_08440 [Methanothermobacter tenebrarum]|uniref:Uncharacterized protein n=1 Tax=Methanothermobacter tenebrarum TaxID=680118 RepID=A0ABM7YBD3_9EURY|nr:hypothetical protein MTTB_08440 [Methanothermobacter tenebrarum]